VIVTNHGGGATTAALVKRAGGALKTVQHFQTMAKLELGKYQHYKGKKYLVLGLARHSETLEDLKFMWLYTKIQC
jgi:hypothetical protein